MTALDMTESIAPRSDQLNADDLMTGPRTFTITEVKKGSAEQPFDFHLVEFPGRPFRPSKSMRRVMVMAWGKDASTYAGKRLRLYRDPEIMFGRDKVGGIRIEAMSHIDKPLTVALTVTRGKRAPYVVQPLAEIPDYVAEASAAPDLDTWRQVWQRAKSAGHMTDALNAALKPIGEALKTPPAAETAPIPGTEND